MVKPPNFLHLAQASAHIHRSSVLLYFPYRLKSFQSQQLSVLRAESLEGSGEKNGFPFFLQDHKDLASELMAFKMNTV